MKTSLPFASIGLGLGVIALAALSQASSAQAQQTVTFAPNPAPTIITSAPYTISTAGVYQLGANLSYTPTGAKNEAIITITANNVTLDLGGHYLSGPVATPTTTLFGIYSAKTNNVTIQNGTVSHCSIGVFMDNSAGTTTTGLNPIVQNLLVNANYGVGIEFLNTSNGQVLGNRITNTGGGTKAVGGIPAICAIGVDTRYSTVVSGNVISTVGVTRGYSEAYGIYGHNLTLTVVGNTIDTIGVVGSVPGTGIEEGILVRGNQISNCDRGMTDTAIYQDNLTANVTRPFNGGTDGGGNN